MRLLLALLLLCADALTTRAEIASCYGREHGQTRTAIGAQYRPWAKVAGYFGAAHRTLPFGTLVLVCRARADSGNSPSAGVNALSQPIGASADGRCVTVIINDRGPYFGGRAIDLSLGACAAIGNSGLARVSLQVVGEIHETHSRHSLRHHAMRHPRRRGADRARARRL